MKKEESNKKKILVMEDEIPLQNAIRIKLTNNGFDVFTARRVINGMDIFENEEKIDAIWADHYLLGREDGFDLVSKIKKSKKGKSIPIFVVSNTASDESIKKYKKLGINKYFTKSDYKLEEIVNDIKQYFSQNIQQKRSA